MVLFGATRTLFLILQPPRTRQVTFDPARNVKILAVAIRALRRTVICFNCLTTGTTSTVSDAGAEGCEMFVGGGVCVGPESAGTADCVLVVVPETVTTELLVSAGPCATNDITYCVPGDRPLMTQRVSVV